MTTAVLTTLWLLAKLVGWLIAIIIILAILRVMLGVVGMFWEIVHPRSFYKFEGWKSRRKLKKEQEAKEKEENTK
ncbi:hypothetical protein Kirov_162 [Bacillus phage Kirov]|uniref:Uncharacterized protein n=1 Tax=Bacillus phage Kirov TaxID=2783539 RepID=A0A7U3NKL8_9CAUD|nr:hypothetical protein PQE67_gp142 [Bacillus phage Kirov]QOV08361.1 hypothetical protein Kirov_162 [Bacillus phage Kirov]